jgi:hypothetical protein
MAEVTNKKETIEVEVVEEFELQTTFNTDTLDELVEEGELENVYEENK